MRLYLGTHRPTWLRDESMPPLFVSRSTMPRTRRYRSVVPWALDSGGFTELQRHGRWRISAAQYAHECGEIVEQVGSVVFVAPQDWMSEPEMIHGGRIGPLSFVGTGLSVDEHQARTVENLLELRDLAPSVPFVPVLQGYTLDDYVRCVGRYELAGVHLPDEPLVGVGSVCRRQHTAEAARIFRVLAEGGLSLHGFGFKQQGIATCWPWLTSADSLAWSFNARADARRGVRRGCGRDVSCANHRHYALEWYADTIRFAGGAQQLTFGDALDGSHAGS